MQRSLLPSLSVPWGAVLRQLVVPHIFYLLVGAGTVGGTALTFLHVNPISLLVVSAVVNGVAAAPFLALTMLIASDREIMGDLRNGRVASWLGWVAVALMAVAAPTMLFTGGG